MIVAAFVFVGCPPTDLALNSWVEEEFVVFGKVKHVCYGNDLRKFVDSVLACTFLIGDDCLDSGFETG